MMPEPGLEDLFLKLGENITFPSGVLKGVLNFELYTVDGGSTGFGGIPTIETLYTMLCRTSEWDRLAIADGTAFTVTDGTYLYNFIALKERPDNSGVSEITLSFRDKVHV
jgi:hypothetical protein